MYQSTGSLHSDGHSSNSMSPAPSPSPTNLKGANNPNLRPHTSGGSSATPIMPSGSQPRNLSGSMSNLAITKKWGSTSDFRDASPGPQTPNGGPMVHRRLQQTGSMNSLRSPFGSQSNLDRPNRHG